MIQKSKNKKEKYTCSKIAEQETKVVRYNLLSLYYYYKSYFTHTLRIK